MIPCSIARSSTPALITAILISFASLAAPAAADGKFFRRPQVADEPGIQAQRAVICYRDGIETLIVESDVDSPDTEYGWLLPLPAEPMSIEACEPYTLTALAQVVQPRVATFPMQVFSVATLLALLIFAVSLSVQRRRGLASVWEGIKGALLIVLLFLLLNLMFLPSLGRGRADADGVSVLQTVNAGVYDVAVIKGDTGEVVQAWLSDNGFTSPLSATAVINDYIADGWCFVAAKISPDAAGTVTHHPLKVVFPADEAVYPLRLTGSDGEPVRLDLFVIADRRATAPRMRAWHSATFTQADSSTSVGGEFGNYAFESPPVFHERGGGYPLVGIPAVSSLMWSKCTLTRLHGRLSVRDMREDLTVSWRSPEPVLATVHPIVDALLYAGTVASLVFAVLFMLLAFSARKRGWPVSRVLKRHFLPACGLGLLAGTVWHATLDVVPTQDGRRQWAERMVFPHLHSIPLRNFVETPPALPFPEAYRQELADYEAPIPIREASDLNAPGDFTIEATDDGWRLTILDDWFIPVTILIDADGRPRPGAPWAPATTRPTDLPPGTSRLDDLQHGQRDHQ